MPFPNDVDLGTWHYIYDADELDTYMDMLAQDHLPDHGDGPSGTVHGVGGLVEDDFPLFIWSKLAPEMEYVDDLEIDHITITTTDMNHARAARNSLTCKLCQKRSAAITVHTIHAKTDND